MHLRTHTRYIVLTLSLAWLVAPPSARADSFSDARAAFAEGDKFYKDGSYEKAAKRYGAAYRMSQAPVILFNIAQANRRQFQKSGNYDNLVEAARLFKDFIDKANPPPNQRTVAEQNLAEVRGLSVDEAKRRFQKADSAYKKANYLVAIKEYDAAYQLSARPEILYNIAQSERWQFEQDSRLARLARAEGLVKSYRRLSGTPGNLATIDELLSILKNQRVAYQRKREAQARSKEVGEMRNARDQYAQGNGIAALTALDRAEKKRGKTRLELVQIYRLRGQAAILAKKPGEAAEAFKQYLALEPASDGTGLSKESASAFAEAKEYWANRAPLKIDHLPPGTIAPKKPVTVPVQITSDPLKMIADRKFRFRREGAKAWTSMSMRNDAEEVNLPPNPMPEGRAYKVQYYITATDANTNQLDTLGSSSSPLAFLVSKDAIIHPPPIYKRWWFWAAAGAVVAGGITTYAVIKSNELPGTMIGDVSE